VVIRRKRGKGVAPLNTMHRFFWEKGDGAVWGQTRKILGRKEDGLDFLVGGSVND